MSAPPGVFADLGQGHEHDPRWTAVDAYTHSHLTPPDAPNHEALAYALTNSLEKGLPDIATFPAQSKMLALQCRFGGVTHALEVGTLGGYTPIWMATLNPALKVTAIEVDEWHATVARENLQRAGVADRVEVVVGKGLDVLPKLKEQIERGEKEPLGLTYIDADKENNWAYFDLAVGMSRPGAAIYVDNVVRKGRLVSEEHLHRSEIQGSRLLVENVGKDKRVDAVVQQTVNEKNYDGYLMAIVR